MPSGAVGVSYALHYFYLLHQVGSSDRRHFLFYIMLRTNNALIFPKELFLINDLTNFEKILLAFLIDMEYSRRYSQIDVSYLTSSINKSFNKIHRSLNSLERKGYLTYALTSEYKEIKKQNILIDFSVNIEKIYYQ